VACKSRAAASAVLHCSWLVATSGVPLCDSPVPSTSSLSRPPPVRGCVILNPAAGGADAAAALQEAVEAMPGLVLYESTDAADARARAARAARESCDVVVAAGGDGTIHDVVNGLMEGAEEGGNQLPALAVVPLGTGNDLARTLALPDDPALAFELACKGARRRLDLIRLDAEGRTLYAINVCAGGFSGAVNEQLTPELKQTWGPLSYLVGAARALPELDGYQVRIAWDDGPEEPVDAVNIVVANGRTAAGGRPAAPRANPEDGLLDVVIVHPSATQDLPALAAALLAGDYLTSEHVLFRRARSLRVRAMPGMWFNADGELFTKEPIRFEVVPKALDVIVGPSYSPDPEAPIP
jgi:diacylglycerol kinase (ATP)